MQQEDHSKITPLIGPEKTLPEITVKAVVLSIILTILLCASNAYLGLKVGNTISASIPAAVIAMGLLRFFKRSNVLENNMVQTAASVGEGLVAGIAFVLPALLIMHYWTNFHFWTTLVIALFGGVLGMLFIIPVRRVMLALPDLRFPEGYAIGTVLKASADKETSLRPLLLGGLIGGLIHLFQSGFRILAGAWQTWGTKGSIVMGFGLGFSPALIAAGYIVGIIVSISMFIGVLIGWVIGVPVLTAIYGIPHAATAAASANAIWAAHLRYIGVGTMLVGGLWTILTLLKPIYAGIQTSMASVRAAKQGKGALRTDRDIPFNLVMLLILAMLIVVFFSLFSELHAAKLGISMGMHIAICVVGILFILIGGFLFASIAAYFAGLVGSTNSPVSGLIVSVLMLFSLTVLGIFALFSHLDHAREMDLAAFAVMLAAVIGSITTIANDSMQDFRAGQMVGATPWKQQAILILGVVVSAFVITPILELLYNAYGIGGVFPRPGMPVSQMLAAPQAGLMAAVAQGVFTQKLPWSMLITGGVIAGIVIIIDEFLKTRGRRLPVLAVGIGVYLPLSSSMPMILGGLISYFAHRRLKRKVGNKRYHQDENVRASLYRTLLLACGVVAGASIMGVVLAVPFAIERSANAWMLVKANFAPIGDVLSILVTIALCYWIYRTVQKQD